jgi:ATP-binding cassette subfamily B protein RaxB
MTLARILGAAVSGRLPDIRQTEATECGLACLAMVARFHGRRTELNALRRQFPVSLQGMTLKTLIGVAAQMGFAARPLRLEPASLKELRTPAILHWDMDHFVVLKRVSRSGATIHDPALGERRCDMTELSRHFTGVALELRPNQDYREAAPPPRRSLLGFLGPMTGLSSGLTQVLILSIILQLHAVVSPFYMQTIVDDALAKSDGDLVLVLATGFALFLLIKCAAALLRARVLAHVHGALAFQMGASLFRHLLSLPISYFEQRHVGDLVSRFGSTEPVRQLVAEGLVTALIDGAMASVTAAVILFYSPRLAAVVMGAVIVYAAVRLLFYRLMRCRALDLIAARARESSTFIETVRAVQSIRIFNREAERGTVWLNRHAEVVQADVDLTLLRQKFAVLNDLVFGAENIVVIYLGALAVLRNDLTIGMLFAFMAYKQQLVEKAAALIEKAIELRMLHLHLDRLADITEAKADRQEQRPSAYRPEIRGEIELRDVSFRYTPDAPPVFEGVCLHVRPGDYVALTGPSGGGKTTLMKIILGLLTPTCGEVLIDGMPLPVLGPEVFRAGAGVVMQDDHLLSGSIADNICFFDDSFDLQLMMQCAQFAGMHDEIMRMPMTYNSLIGDMGTWLSGGQKQRILLARALYRRPRVLLMDEGTSHLDLETERRVNESVKSLGLTRLIIAHRPETIASAGRRVMLTPRGVFEGLEAA